MELVEQGVISRGKGTRVREITEKGAEWQTTKKESNGAFWKQGIQEKNQKKNRT